MKVALIGATGFVGSAILKEAQFRGFEITAIARDSSKVQTGASITAVSADINDVDALASILSGHDAVINSFNAGWANPNLYNDFLEGCKHIQAAVKKSGVKRLLIIGGAGSLYAGDKQLVDTPEFPTDWKVGASAARDYLNVIREEEDLDWTFLSPAINLHPGERTGCFRIGNEHPVSDTEGKSDISVEDLAVAAINELEENQFIKARFTVGY